MAQSELGPFIAQSVWQRRGIKRIVLSRDVTRFSKKGVWVGGNYRHVYITKSSGNSESVL